MAKHIEVEVSEEEFFRQRTLQIREAKEEGMEIYPHKFDAKDSFRNIKELANKCEVAEKSNLVVKSAGRISTIRHHAKFSFLTLTSDFVDLQIILYKETDEQKKIADFVKRGDIVGFEGHYGKSKTGEPSVFVEAMTILSPCLRVIPSNRNSLTDPETIYRKRHIDLIVNKDSMKRFLDRSVIISHIRNYFNEMDFIEVETPMMSVSAGGAAARPFVTHHNELKLDLFMRVAPELFLKKLVIGGMNRVFEIGRNFRNEGIDLTHNPEFTSIEFYMAYVDYRDMMDIVEDLLSKLVVKAKGSKKFTYEPLKRGGEEVKVDLDFSTPFQRLDILEEINSILRLQLTGENISKPENLELLIEAAEKNNLEISEPKTLNRVLDAFIGEYIEPRCINPTFVTGFPVAMSPLAKDDRNRKGITERFEMFLNGKEICNAYTELNIPDVQRERFLMQAADANAGDDEAMPADEDFCQALEFALPPTGGCGIGIDRLVMYLTNAANIRDVILFPTMKPENN